jgi:hypothetical protein
MRERFRRCSLLPGLLPPDLMDLEVVALGGVLLLGGVLHQLRQVEHPGQPWPCRNTLAVPIPSVAAASRVSDKRWRAPVSCASVPAPVCLVRWGWRAAQDPPGWAPVPGSWRRADCAGFLAW